MSGRDTAAQAETYTLDWILCWICVGMFCYVYYGFTNEDLFLALFHLIKTKVAKIAPFSVLSPFKLFSAYHSVWKGKSVSLCNFRNKDLAAMLLENFGIQINSKLVFWPEFTANLLLLSKRLLAFTRSSNYPLCLLNLSEKNAQLWRPKVNVLMCVLSRWSQSVAWIWKKKLHENIVQGSTCFKRLSSFTNRNTVVGTILNRAMQLVCAFSFLKKFFLKGECFYFTVTGKLLICMLVII